MSTSEQHRDTTSTDSGQPVDTDPSRSVEQDRYADQQPVDQPSVDQRPADDRPWDEQLDPADRHQADDTDRVGSPGPAADVDPAPPARVPEPTTVDTTPSAPAMTTAGTYSDDRERLVSVDRADSYGSRWKEVKGMFVDEPRQAVAQADRLVGELLEELEQLFREQRRNIEQGLDSDETSTEDLRLALRRYRSFFDRLLSL